MRGFLAIVAMAALSACSGSFSEGPDEFGVVPSKPLAQPESLTDLPSPTPGAQNRADVTPIADAVAALGGRVSGGGIPASDSGVVTFASRFGVDPAIRSELFAEDEAYRQRRIRLGRFGLGGGDRYFRAYAGQTLDAYAELERFRSAGVRVPTAPPR